MVVDSWQWTPFVFVIVYARLQALPQEVFEAGSVDGANWFQRTLYLTLPLLALSGFIAVCGTVAYSVAVPALVPSLVPPQQLPAANARIELARTIAFASGPALGGALVGWLGAAPAFGFAAALYLDGKPKSIISKSWDVSRKCLPQATANPSRCYAVIKTSSGYDRNPHRVSGRQNELERRARETSFSITHRSLQQRRCVLCCTSSSLLCLGLRSK